MTNYSFCMIENYSSQQRTIVSCLKLQFSERNYSFMSKTIVFEHKTIVYFCKGIMAMDLLFNSSIMKNTWGNINFWLLSIGRRINWWTHRGFIYTKSGGFWQVRQHYPTLFSGRRSNCVQVAKQRPSSLSMPCSWVVLYI